MARGPLKSAGERARLELVRFSTTARPAHDACGPRLCTDVACSICLYSRFAPSFSAPDAVVIISVAPFHQAAETEETEQAEPAPVRVVVAIAPIAGCCLSSGGLICRGGWGSTSLAERGNG